MAIQTQYPYVDNEGNENPKLIKTYSDEGLNIRQNETGNEYEEAVDIYPTPYTYEEIIEPEVEETEEIENE